MSAAEGKAVEIADAAARRRALDPAASFVVQAPAGSGKTELLVRRFLSLLARVSRPEAVLAITFTRKAAGEMRERIIGALRQADELRCSGGAAGEKIEDERVALALKVLDHADRSGWDLLKNPARLQVSTIDALSARLAHSMPLLSRCGGTPRTTEDPRQLYRAAARKALRQQEVEQAVGVLLERQDLSLSQLEDQIVELLACREQWAGLAREAPGDAALLFHRVEKGFARVIDLRLHRLHSLLRPGLAAAVHQVATLTRQGWDPEKSACPWPTLGDRDRLDDDTSDVQVWEQAANLLLTGKDELRRPGGINKKMGAPPKSAAKAAYDALLKDIAEWPSQQRTDFLQRLAVVRKLPRRAEFDDDGREALLALFEVLVYAHAELWLVFVRREVVDFTEVALRGLEALGDATAPSPMLERLDQRIDHILVDEFQDTNVVQCRLLRSLTAGWTEQDGRTLFLVGDPMQSIYRFRNAEVGLFVEARAGRGALAHIRLHPLTLSVNFRSTSSILEWINDHFSGLFGDTDDAETAAVAYAPFDSSPDAETGSAVETLAWVEEGASDGDKVATAAAMNAEAAGLAERIQEQWLPQAKQRDPNATVAVLVRSKTHAVALMQALAARGVPYRAGGVEKLGDRAVIHDLTSLVRVLLHPADRLAALALLRSAFVGVSVADLCGLVEADVAEAARKVTPRTVLWQLNRLQDNEGAALSEDGRRRALRLWDVLDDALAEVGRRPLDVIGRGVWLALGGPACYGGVGLGDAERFFSLLADVSQEGAVDLDLLAARLAELDASEDGDPAVGVQFVTIHKAKGLEFDTVVLPCLGKKPRNADSALLAMETNPATGDLELVAPSGARGRQADDDRKQSLIRSREDGRETAERKRLLYVAATRACKHLVLSFAPTEIDGQRRPRAPYSQSLLGTAWEALGSTLVSTSPPRPDAAALPVVKHSQRIGVGVGVAAHPAPALASSVVRARPSAATQIGVADPTNHRALRVGDAVHAFLERIAAEGVDRWDGTTVGAAAPGIRRILTRLGAREELDSECETVMDALANTLADSKGRWMLSPQQQSRSEWEITALREGRLITATLDRTFVADGDRWVIDFKTGGASVVDSGLPAYVDKQREAYRGQLEAYQALLSDPQGRLPGVDPAMPVRMALFFTHLPKGWRWQEL